MRRAVTLGRDGLQTRGPRSASATGGGLVSGTSPSGESVTVKWGLLLIREAAPRRRVSGQVVWVPPLSSAAPTPMKMIRRHRITSTKGVTVDLDIGRRLPRRPRPRPGRGAAVGGDRNTPSVELPRQEGPRTRRQKPIQPRDQAVGVTAEPCCRGSPPGMAAKQAEARGQQRLGDAGGHDRERGVARDGDFPGTTA